MAVLPVKLYLQKQLENWICPTGNSLMTPALKDKVTESGYDAMITSF